MRFSLQKFVIGLVLIFVAGCSSDDPAGPGEGEGRVRMYIADAPANMYSEVNVEIERVEVYSEGSGWLEVSGEAEIYNLLELTNGKMATLVDINLEADTYSRVRVHVGGRSNIVVDGSVVNVTIGSGFQNGVVLEQQIELQAGSTVEILLDFDAHSSVKGSVVTGLRLEPAIRIQSMERAGNISGRVSPVQARAVIVASQNGEVVTSTYADESSGEYKLVGLAEGTYDIEIVARAGEYETKKHTNVSVEARQTTNLGHTVLESNNNNFNGPK